MDLPTALFTAAVLMDDGVALGIRKLCRRFGIERSVGARFNSVGGLLADQLGRLPIENAHGSELIDLPVRRRTEVYDGARFVDDSSDSCSRVRVTDLTTTPSPGRSTP